MKHLIIGTGPAGIAAAETIRQLGSPDDGITLIGDEPAYARMALPYWAAGEVTREHVFIGDAPYFEKLRIETLFGRRVRKLDAGGKQVHLDDGTKVAYDRLLIATGSSPARPSLPGMDLPGVVSFWTIDDAARAIAALETGRRVVLVGAGFIGFIVLNALEKRGCELAVVEVAAQVLPRMLDATGAGMVARWLEKRGVAIHAAARVSGIALGADGKPRVKLDTGSELAADLVIMATGIRPNVSFLEGAGIKVGEGIVVDGHLRTSVPDVYAAGDVAQGPVLGGGSAVHAIQPTAVEHGRVAGANMAGKAVPYRGSLLINVVDVCDLHCASFGDWLATGREVTTVVNERRPIYRKLVWDGDRLVGASFVGPKADVTLLNDLGMVKGMIQTQVEFGAVKAHLQKFPFELRKAFVQLGVAARLYRDTLLGAPSTERPYRYLGARPPTGPVGPHADLVGTRPQELESAPPTPTPGIFKPKA